MQNPNNKLKKIEYVRFLIRSNRNIWENDKSYLIKYSDNQTFFWPKGMVWKQEVNTTGEFLFNTTASGKDAPYLQLSFAKEPIVYTDKNGNNYELKDVEIRTKISGELDSQGNQIYKSTKISLYDLRKHFAKESKEILDEAKKIKEKHNSTNKTQNSQIQTLN